MLYVRTALDSPLTKAVYPVCWVSAANATASISSTSGAQPSALGRSHTKTGRGQAKISSRRQEAFAVFRLRSSYAGELESSLTLIDRR